MCLQVVLGISFPPTERLGTRLGECTLEQTSLSLLWHLHCSYLSSSVSDTKYIFDNMKSVRAKLERAYNIMVCTSPVTNITKKVAC